VNQIDSQVAGAIEDVEPRGPLESFDRWERQQWRIADLDLTADRAAWQALPTFIAREMRSAIDRFFLGESAVTETLAPMAHHAPTSGARFFLCTQLADEARHTLFFVRYLAAVNDTPELRAASADAGPYVRARWAESAPYFSGLLDEELREVTGRLNHDDDPAAFYQAVTIYHLLVEGVLGVAGQRALIEATRRRGGLEVLRAGLQNIARDESRHIRFGVGALHEGVRAGHGDAIAEQILRSVEAAVWVVIAPERALPALMPPVAREAAARAATRTLSRARGALLGRMERVGIGHRVEAVDAAWQRGVDSALDHYRETHGRTHPVRASVAVRHGATARSPAFSAARSTGIAAGPYARDGLLDWLQEPTAGNGFHFAHDDGSWDLWDYPKLASAVMAGAQLITELSHRPGGNVSIVARNGPEFAAAFLGALLAGSTPSPLALPIFARNRRVYVEHAATILRTAEPTLVLAEPIFLGLMTEAAEMAGLPHTPQPLVLPDPPSNFPRATPSPVALLQFTSGTSGRPRGVRVTWQNLEANIAHIRRWLAMGPNDTTATWLPIYHDMGLIGAFLTPIVNKTSVWMMRPDQFISDPLRWLDCFGCRSVNTAVGPNFGFAYAAKRLTDDFLEGKDFSAWRAAIVGAERLDPAVLGGFARRLEPYGFRTTAFMPAYGLAEATLAVSGVALGAMPRCVKFDWSQARFGRSVAVTDEAPLTDHERIGMGDGWLVGCGTPHPGLTATIVDDDGVELPGGTLGEICVAGETVADGYEREAAGGSTRFEGGGVVRTGDAGVMLDGELFVVGRLGDAVKIRGRTVFVEDVETRIAGIDGVQKGKCVVLAGSDGDTNLMVAVVERKSPGDAWVRDVAAILQIEAAKQARVQVLAAPPGTIERTSSGKPRRRVMWARLLDQGIDAELVYDGEGP
jgi:acyl-CoA synthetase (AMP-forming)/AMP-acid ligase II